MSEQGKGSLLLPLGLGAAVVLLYMGMKKKEAAQPSSSTDTAALLPEVKEGESSVPQINPSPAPSYTQISRMTDAGDGDDDDTDKETDASGQEDESEEEQSSGSSYEQGEEDDDSNTSSSSVNNFITSQRPVIPAAGRQVIPPSSPFYVPAGNNPVVNARHLVSNSQFVARQLVKPAMHLVNARRKVVNLATQKLRANMQIRANQQVLPSAAAPNTTIRSAQQPFVNITSNAASQPAAVPVVQPSIFPLKFGTTSPYVKEVQRKLGVSSTGYFGTMTRTAIQKRYRVSEISEALYKQIITGKVKSPVVRKTVVNPISRARKPVVKRHVKVKHR